MSWLKKNKSLVALFCITVILCLIPVIFISYKIGNNWQGVSPQIIDDDLYYYARMQEVKSGYPFLGNPYFIEYRNALAPAFIFPDWVSALPLFFGLPLIWTIVFNFVFWAVLFSFLLYFIARRFDLSPPISVFISVLSFLEVYWLILRPVAMQIVFPAFLLFLLSLILWLEQKESRKRTVLLIISSSLSFYLYTYLWQIVVVILGLFFIYFLIKKQWKDVRNIFIIGLSTILLSIPVLIFTIKQLHASFYFETITRIGFVATHLPTIYAYFYGRWTVIILAAYFLIRWAVRTSDPSPKEGMNSPELVFVISGVALFITSVSNLITGKELETALHIGRFITLWIALFVPVLLFKWWREGLYMTAMSSSQKRIKKIAVIVGLLLFLLPIGFLLSNFQRSLPISHILNTDFKKLEEYGAPINWLNQNVSSSTVIWANEEISNYVPMMTDNYVLWNHLGILHLMPSYEAENRFLVAWMGTSTSAKDLVGHFREYEGTGPVWKYTDEYYKNKLRCLFGSKCMPDKRLDQWIEPKFLSDLSARQAVLKNNLEATLKKYQVTYAIADKTLAEDLYLNKLPFLKPVWTNDRFVIYKVK